VGTSETLALAGGNFKFENIPFGTYAIVGTSETLALAGEILSLKIFLSERTL
jgi:hypothetical protein